MSTMTMTQKLPPRIWFEDENAKRELDGGVSNPIVGQRMYMTMPT